MDGEFFKPRNFFYDFFLGRSMNFFSFNFALCEFFFCKFSNGPSLN